MIEKKIKGASLYTISDSGEVRSYTAVGKGRVMKAQLNRGKQYLQVRILYDDKHYRTRYVHDLVAENFIGKKPPKFDVDHIDGNKLNNHTNNLRYCSRRENMCNPNNIDKNWWQKLSSRKVIVHKGNDIMHFPNLLTACQKLNVSISSASCQIRGVLKNAGMRNGKPHLVKVHSVKGYVFEWDINNQ